MTDPVVVPGGRDVRGSLDRPAEAASVDSADPDRLVVACPPHPQMGGSRTDGRLTAVADALTERGIACLRFDYGPWDEGRGELADVRNALEWAHDECETVGLFGYSFGGCLALVAAAREADDGADLAAVSALAPAPRIDDDDVDAVEALDGIGCPGQVVYGTRDDTVDWRPVVERARERGFAVTELAADHHFVGQAEKVGRVVGEFFAGER